MLILHPWYLFRLALDTYIVTLADTRALRVIASSVLLTSSFDPSTPPAASSYVGPSYPSNPRFSDTLRHRWNLALSRAVDGVRETDWRTMGLVVVDETGKIVKRISAQVQGSETAQDIASSASSASSSASASASSAASSVTDAASNAASSASSAMSSMSSKIAENARSEVVVAEVKDVAHSATEGVESWWSRLQGAVQETERKAEKGVEAVGDEVRELVRRGEREGEKIEASGAGVVGGDIRKESFTGGSERWVKAKRTVEAHEGRLV